MTEDDTERETWELSKAAEKEYVILSENLRTLEEESDKNRIEGRKTGIGAKETRKALKKLRKLEMNIRKGGEEDKRPTEKYQERKKELDAICEELGDIYELIAHEERFCHKVIIVDEALDFARDRTRSILLHHEW